MSSNNNNENEPELSTKEREALRKSIRSNGLIRPIHKKAKTSLNMEPIEPGTTLVNFHKEYVTGRYYTPEQVQQILESPYRINPYTRQPLSEEQVSSYIASVNGNTGGKNIYALESAYFRSELPKPVEVLVQQFPPFSPHKQSVPSHTTESLGQIVEKFILANPDKYPTLEKGYTAFVGIPIQQQQTINTQSKNNYLLNPFVNFIYKNKVITHNLSDPLSKFNTTESVVNFIAFSRLNPPPINIPIPQRFQDFNGRVDREYTEIWNSILEICFEMVLPLWQRYLTEHPTDFENYKQSIFSPELLSFGNALGKIVFAHADTLVKQFFDEKQERENERSASRPWNYSNMRMRFGGKRSRKSKKSRKHRKSRKSTF